MAAGQGKPRLITPPGACDCHMHVFDGRFPLAANARRKESDAPVSEYRKVQSRLGLERVVVVQPTAYGKDNRCTVAAIAAFGEGARGIAVVDDSIGDAELERLTAAGIRGVRFRMLDTPELSGAYMVSKSGPPLYEDIGVLAKALVSRAPERLVWASNWPHPLPSRTAAPDDAGVLDVLLGWAPDEETRNRILADNPAELYGFVRRTQ